MIELYTGFPVPLRGSAWMTFNAKETGSKN